MQIDLGPFSPVDAIAVAVLIALWLASGWLIEHPPARRLSVSYIMADYRREWMRQFVTRQPRIFDATVIDSLRQGTAFFASASMIAIGGGVALIGNSAQVEGLASDLQIDTDGVVIEVKIILVILILSNALLKFIWAHRLFGYCSILMAAVPNDAENVACLPRALQAAEINITAAKSFNRGLRSIYFSLAALAWMLGAGALIAGAIVATGVLMRREFTSHSRQVMLEHLG